MLFVREATAQPGQILAVVGRSQAGVSELLHQMGQQISPDNVLFIDARVAPLPVAELLACLGRDVEQMAQQVGLLEHLAVRATDLPVDLVARMQLAYLTFGPSRSTVIVDTIMDAASQDTKQAAATALRRRARAGAAVVWSEHDLNLIWGTADRIIEVRNGQIVFFDTPEVWVPRSLPEPVLLSLARMFAIAPTAARSVESIHNLLVDRRPRRVRQPRVAVGNPEYVVNAADLRLHGEPIALSGHETVGIIVLDGRSENLAAQLIGLLPGAERIPSRLGDPGERLHRTIYAPGPVWLPHPQLGLDAHARTYWADALAGAESGLRILTSRDHEFLIRSCHRLLIVRDSHLIGDGTPHAVSSLLPEPPLVARASGNPELLRLSDIAWEVA